MEGGPTIPLQDWYFLYVCFFWYVFVYGGSANYSSTGLAFLVFEGGLVFFGFFFGVALLVSYVANYGLNGLSPATGRHTYIGGTW